MITYYTVQPHSVMPSIKRYGFNPNMGWVRVTSLENIGQLIDWFAELWKMDKSVCCLIQIQLTRGMVKTFNHMSRGTGHYLRLPAVYSASRWFFCDTPISVIQSAMMS